jgi:membrane-associated phospholipid phosphatase
MLEETSDNVIILLILYLYRMRKILLGFVIIFLAQIAIIKGGPILGGKDICKNYIFHSSLSKEKADSVKCRLHLKNYIVSGFVDAKDIIIAPIRWKASQWVVFGGTALVAGIAYTQDVRINQFTSTNKNEVATIIGDYIAEPWGRGIYPLGIMGSMFLYGTFSKECKYQYVAMNGLKTFVLAAVAVSIPKYLFQRHRPFENNPADNSIFEGPLGDFTHTSFPSGHTTVAFAMSTYLAQQFKSKKWVAPLVYSLAALTAMQRVYDNRHWTSDIVIGAALGYGIAKVVCNKKNWNVAVVPYHDGVNTQLGFSVSKQL